MDKVEENLHKNPISRYKTKSIIGKTKSTVVFKATDTTSDEDVALKIVNNELYKSSQKEDLLKQFDSHAKILTGLEHPNIVNIIDHGVYKDMPFLVTEFMSGGTLIPFTGSPRNWLDVFTILLPIADALAYVHEQNIVHRDVKPSNILIGEDGTLYLTDFSVIPATEAAKHTYSTTGIGDSSPDYMAPEQWQGKESPAVDQYSFGVILYELLTGTLPYDASNVVSLLVQQATGIIEPPSKAGKNVPPIVDAAVLKTLSTNPDERFSSMTELKNVMQKLIKNADSLNDLSTSRKKTTSEKSDEPEAKEVNDQGVRKRKRQEKKQADTTKDRKPEKSSAQSIKEKKGQAKGSVGNFFLFFGLGLIATIAILAIAMLVGILLDIPFFTNISEEFSRKLISNTSATQMITPPDKSTKVYEATDSTWIPTQETYPDPETKTRISNMVIQDIGGMAGKLYYSSSGGVSYSPQGRIAGRGNLAELRVGDEFEEDIEIITRKILGLTISFDSQDRSEAIGQAFIYESSKVFWHKSDFIHLSIESGSVYLDLVAPNEKAILSIPNHAVELEITNGKALVSVNKTDVKVWCIKDTCELKNEKGTTDFTAAGWRSVYNPIFSGIKKQKSNPIERHLKEFLKEMNAKCNKCMNN